MKSCRWSHEVERLFDGQSESPEATRRHVEQCPNCRSYQAVLTELRGAAAGQAAAGEIDANQFPAFMRGIQDGLAAPARRYGRMWAVVSLAAAALVVAASMFLVIDKGTAPVDATVVESFSTELEGASITTYDTADGVTTVWITVTQEDVW